MTSPIIQLTLRIIFTCGFLFIIILCAMPIYLIWFDRPIVYKPFKYIRDGKPDEQALKGFMQLVDSDISRLRNILYRINSVSYGINQREAMLTPDIAGLQFDIAESDRLMGEHDDINIQGLNADLTPSLEIEVYGLKISNIFRSIKRLVIQPMEIAVNVIEEPGLTDAKKILNIDGHIRVPRYLVGPNIRSKAWGKYEGEHKIPQLFRNSFLVAADIVNESLEKDKPGYLISQASRNVSVYYAGDDLALRASKVINLKNGIASRRLGHSGPEDITKVSKNVYSIDCDEINIKYDKPAGHSYFAVDGGGENPGVVFNHIRNSIKTGRVFVDSEGDRSIILDVDTKFAVTVDQGENI